RDGLPVEVLSKLMRWPGVARVWLPEWLQNREATLERIEDAADEAEDVLESRTAMHFRPRVLETADPSAALRPTRDSVHDDPHPAEVRVNDEAALAPVRSAPAATAPAMPELR